MIPRRGRPRLPADVARLARLEVRVTAAELAELTAAAAQAGEDRAAWVRRVALDSARRSR